VGIAECNSFRREMDLFHKRWERAWPWVPLTTLALDSQRLPLPIQDGVQQKSLEMFKKLNIRRGEGRRGA